MQIEKFQVECVATFFARKKTTTYYYLKIHI